MNTPLKKGSLFYKTIDTVELLRDPKGLEIDIRVAVEDDVNVIRALYDTQAVEDHVIKLYIVVNDETLITKGKKSDIRSAGIRMSNITEITGVVLGDKVFDLFDNHPEKTEKYVTKLANDLIDNSSQLVDIEKILRKKFTYYMENKRSVLFPLPSVGIMIREQLQLSLQEFWKPVLTTLANDIRTLKLEDEAYWQPYTPQGQLKTSKEFTPLLGQGVSAAQRYSKTFLDTFNTIDLVMQDYLDLKLIESAKKLNKVEHRSQLKVALAKIYELFTDVLGFFKNGILEVINKLADKVYELNAFLVGLFNGVIEFIASIPELIGFLSGLLSGDGYALWQAVKKEYKTLQEKGAFIYLFEAIGKFFDSISKRYDTSQDKYLIIKNLGEDCIGVLELVFGIFKAGKALVSLGKKTYDAFKKKIDEVFKKHKGEFDELNRNELFSKIKGNPINPKLLKKLQKEFKKLGGDMRFDNESFAYCASREKTLNTKIEAVTLGDDIILLNKNVTVSAVYEELIHARQFRSGRFREAVNKYKDKSIVDNLMEKEAAEELLENSIVWELPVEEIKIVKDRLEYFTNELKKRGYEK